MVSVIRERNSCLVIYSGRVFCGGLVWEAPTSLQRQDAEQTAAHRAGSGENRALCLESTEQVRASRGVARKEENPQRKAVENREPAPKQSPRNEDPLPGEGRWRPGVPEAICGARERGIRWGFRFIFTRS